jgi:hypothetical protein
MTKNPRVYFSPHFFNSVNRARPINGSLNPFFCNVFIMLYPSIWLIYVFEIMHCGII